MPCNFVYPHTKTDNMVNKEKTPPEMEVLPPHLCLDSQSARFYLCGEDFKKQWIHNSHAIQTVEDIPVFCMRTFDLYVYSSAIR